MGKMTKHTFERGDFKEKINKALYNSDDIIEVLLGDVSDLSTTEKLTKFKEHVKSHLFIDDTIESTESFIFYDIICPSLESNIKDCRIILYLICHRDILDGYYKDGYSGNRADILSQIVEDTLINDEKTVNSFGIGELTLDSIDIYNSTHFYGCIMTFSVPTFR